MIFEIEIKDRKLTIFYFYKFSRLFQRRKSSRVKVATEPQKVKKHIYTDSKTPSYSKTEKFLLQKKRETEERAVRALRRLEAKPQINLSKI